MNRSELTRQSFKYNYLKEIILRFDYQGVFQSELEEIIPLIKGDLKSNGFSRYELKASNEMQFDIKPDLSGIAAPTIRKYESFPIHTFVNEDSGFSISLSEKFTAMTVSSSKYIPFEQYENLFLGVCEALQSKVDFLTPKRFGLRKINNCFLTDISKIQEFFSANYYSFSSVLGPNIVTDEKRTFTRSEPFYLNVYSSVREGKLNNDEAAYAIILDSDIYSEDSSHISSILFEEKTLQKLNDILFEVYVDSMTDKTLSILISEDGVPDYLKGVEESE